MKFILKYILSKELHGGSTEYEYEYDIKPYNYSMFNFLDMKNNPKVFVTKKKTQARRESGKHDKMNLIIYENQDIHNYIQKQIEPVAWIKTFTDFFSKVYEQYNDRINKDIINLTNRSYRSATSANNYSNIVIENTTSTLTNNIDLNEIEMCLGKKDGFLIYKEGNLVIFSLLDIYEMQRDINDIDKFKNNNPYIERYHNDIKKQRGISNEASTPLYTSNPEYYDYKTEQTIKEVLDNAGSHEFGILMYKSFVCRILDHTQTPNSSSIRMLDSMRELTRDDANILLDFHTKFRKYICEQFRIPLLEKYFIGGFNHRFLESRKCIITYELHQPTYINYKMPEYGLNFYNLEVICNRLIQNNDYFKQIELKVTYRKHILENIINNYKQDKDVDYRYLIEMIFYNTKENNTYTPSYSPMSNIEPNYINMIRYLDINIINILTKQSLIKKYNDILEIIEYGFRLDNPVFDIKRKCLEYFEESNELRSNKKIINDLRDEFKNSLYNKEIPETIDGLIDKNRNLDVYLENKNYKIILSNLHKLKFIECCEMIHKFKYIPYSVDEEKNTKYHKSFRNITSIDNSTLENLQIVKVFREKKNWKSFICIDTSSTSTLTPTATQSNFLNSYKLVSINIDYELLDRIYWVIALSIDRNIQIKKNKFNTFILKLSRQNPYKILIEDLSPQLFQEYCVNPIFEIININMNELKKKVHNLNKIQHFKNMRKFPYFLLAWFTGLNRFHHLFFSKNREEYRNLIIRSKEFMFGPALDIIDPKDIFESLDNKTSLENLLNMQNINKRLRFLSWYCPKFIKDFIVYDPDIHTYVPIIWFRYKKRIESNNSTSSPNSIEDVDLWIKKIRNYVNTNYSPTNKDSGYAVFQLLFNKLDNIKNSPTINPKNKLEQMVFYGYNLSISSKLSPIQKDVSDLDGAYQYKQEHIPILNYMFTNLSCIGNMYKFDNDVIQTHHIFPSLIQYATIHVRLSSIIIDNNWQYQNKFTDYGETRRIIGSYTLDLSTIIQHLYILGETDNQFIMMFKIVNYLMLFSMI